MFIFIITYPETFFNTDLSDVGEIQESIDELAKLKDKHKQIQKIFVSTLERHLHSLKKLINKYRAAGINSSAVRRRTGLRRIEQSGADLYVAEYRENAKKYIKEQKDLINGMKSYPLFASESDIQNDMRQLTGYLTYISDHFFLVNSVKVLSSGDNGATVSNSSSASSRQEQLKKEKRDTIEAVIGYFEEKIKNLSQRWIVDEEISSLSRLLNERLERKEAIDERSEILKTEFWEYTLKTLFMSIVLAFVTIVAGDVCRAFFHIADTIVWREEK